MNTFEANLVYRVSSRIAIATQRNPVSEKKRKKKKKMHEYIIEGGENGETERGMHSGERQS